MDDGPFGAILSGGTPDNSQKTHRLLDNKTITAEIRINSRFIDTEGVLIR